MQGAAGPFELAEGVQVGVQDLLGQPAELAENLELKFLGHARQFGRAGGIKDDLKRRHGSGAAASRAPAGAELLRGNRMLRTMSGVRALRLDFRAGGDGSAYGNRTVFQP